ncbi:MAG: efflux RND transporter periplasmic adaptor subunit [Chitinophagaceae bacterium]|nr:efflux RND transporter periplasmic adaptor subunit [Chitinophagaceae bacterium]
MKNLLLILAIAFTIASCNSSGAGDKKAKLESLKSEQKDLEKQIKDLETEIGKEAGSKPVEKPVLVSVTEAAAQPFEHYIELQGKVDAEDNVIVTPQLPGTIQSVFVVTGQNVKKGQVLAALDPATINAQIDALKKSLELATLLYDKQKSLWEQNIGTEVQYLTAKNQKESLEKQMSALNEQYQLTKLVSPINGVVDNVDIKAGQVAAPGYAGIRVVNFSNLKVIGEVSESYSSMIHQGDKVKILFPDLNLELDSKISYAAKVINSQSRTFTVESKLPAKEAYKPNMVALLKILDYENKTAFSVPVNLIQNSEEGSYVYVAAEENGRQIAKRKTVTVGRIYNGQAEITGGISAGEKVITVGYQDIIAGQAIKF